MSDDYSETKHKLRLKNIMSVITLVIIIFCIMMSINTSLTNRYNQKSVELSKLHIKYTDIASKLMDGSDTLTEQVRMFSQTGQRKYMDAYFKEANIDRNRDKAINDLKSMNVSARAIGIIEDAMNESVDLMEREYYSMRLTAAAYGIAEDELPEEVKNVSLSPEDSLLSAEEMSKRARELVFGDEYTSEKNKIMGEVDTFLSNMIEEAEREYDVLLRKVNVHSYIQEGQIIALIIIILLLMLFLYSYIVFPIVKAAKNIEKGEAIEMPKFLAEMDSLAQSYNNLQLKNIDLVQQLRFQAETDSLTRLGNRVAYKEYSERIKNIKEKVLLFLFDINNMRDVNNSQGHAAGDTLLCNTAACIWEVFGKNEHMNCFRIGGDEFVAYIIGEDENYATTHINKFNKRQKEYDISVSVGYAYADDMSAESTQKLFNAADKMMYRKKYGDKKQKA